MITTPTVGDDMDATSVFTYPTIEDDSSPTGIRPESPTLGRNDGYTGGSPLTERRPAYNWDQLFSPLNHTTLSDPASVFSFLSMAPTPAPSPQSERQQERSPRHFSYVASNMPSERDSAGSAHAFSFFTARPTSPPPLHIKPPLSPTSRDRKTRSPSFLNPIRLAFPRRSSSPPPGRRSPSGTRVSRGMQTESAPAFYGTSWAFSTSTSSSPSPQPYLCIPPAECKVETRLTDTRGLRRRKRLQSARDWFSPGRLFAAVIPSHYDS